ncbi:MAG: ribosome biogenesis GTPase Der [Spirochaetia bacterium]
MHQGLPRLLILGRPNVGKSTLFNRLLKKKVAITAAISGVTRDVIEHHCRLGNGQEVILLDSAGCRPDTADFLENLAKMKSLEAIQSADLILLVLEGHAIVSEDYSLVDELRKISKPILLVANKCDSPEKDHVLGDLWGLGFGQPICISAEHNRNIHGLENLIKSHLPEKTQPTQAHDPPLRIAILGRPNAGKSSLANCLCKKDNSLVSQVSGTTRDTVTAYFEEAGQIFEILDTAGLRRASKVNESLEFYATRRTDQAIEQCDVALLLVDIEQGLADQDKKIADKIVLHHKPLLFVLSKSDLKQNFSKSVNSMRGKNDILKQDVELLRFHFPVLAHVPVITVSSMQPQTMPALIKAIRNLHSEAGRMVDEHELNDALRDWSLDQPHPRRRGKRPVVCKSLRQVAVHPPKFILRAYGEVEDGYVRYITKNLRKEFKFPHVPLIIDVQQPR